MNHIGEDIITNQKMMMRLMKLVMCFLIALSVFHILKIKTALYYRSPIYRPIYGGLNRYDLTLQVGNEYHLYIFGLNRRVAFSSTDIKVATVNLIGTVKAWRPGTTVIKAKSKGKTLRCRVRVVDLSSDSIELHVGESKRLYVKYALFGVHYSSSDNMVASVSSIGRVKAVRKGRAKITVSFRGKRMYCTVVVT